jgi:hypothetical protein
MKTERIKHLEMIQSVIQRMSTLSSSVRNWAITVTAGLISINATKHHCIIAVAIPLIVAAFAYLDHTYLLLERKYRELYDAVRNEDDAIPVSFNMSIRDIYPQNPSQNGSQAYWLLWGGLALVGLTLSIGT